MTTLKLCRVGECVTLEVCGRGRRPGEGGAPWGSGEVDGGYPFDPFMSSIPEDEPGRGESEA